MPDKHWFLILGLNANFLGHPKQGPSWKLVFKGEKQSDKAFKKLHVDKNLSPSVGRSVLDIIGQKAFGGVLI